LTKVKEWCIITELERTVASWKSLIEAAVNQTLIEINEKCYEIAWHLFTTTVKFTPSPSNPGPTAEGLLANNWFPQVGGTSSEISNSTSSNGAASLERINAVMGGSEFLRKDGLITMANNLSYALRAEKLGWYPPEWAGVSGMDRKGAPYRMVARALQATAAKYK
jgi:hypothetical protein